MRREIRNGDREVIYDEAALYLRVC